MPLENFGRKPEPAKDSNSPVGDIERRRKIFDRVVFDAALELAEIEKLGPENNRESFGGRGNMDTHLKAQRQQKKERLKNEIRDLAFTIKKDLEDFIFEMGGKDSGFLNMIFSSSNSSEALMFAYEKYKKEKR